MGTRVEKINFATFPHFDGMSSDYDVPADLMKEIVGSFPLPQEEF